jgi:hypothetical protein
MDADMEGGCGLMEYRQFETLLSLCPGAKPVTGGDNRSRSKVPYLIRGTIIGTQGFRQLEEIVLYTS